MVFTRKGAPRVIWKVTKGPNKQQLRAAVEDVLGCFLRPARRSVSCSPVVLGVYIFVLLDDEVGGEAEVTVRLCCPRHKVS